MGSGFVASRALENDGFRFKRVWDLGVQIRVQALEKGNAPEMVVNDMGSVSYSVK